MSTFPERQLDTSIEIITPENIAFSYLLAGPFRRLSAFVVDCACIVGIIVAAWILMPFIAYFCGGTPAGIYVGGMLVFTFALSWFYGAFFETVWNGRTPGKRMTGLRVLTVEGQPISAFQAFLRNVLRLADLQPGLFGLVGVVSCTSNDRFQRLGDIAAGTMVVVEERAHTRLDAMSFEYPDIDTFAEKVPSTLYVSPNLTKALALYVHRRKQLPLRRREEIATRLALPLLERCGLPTDTNPDMFLCAVYRTIYTASLENRLDGLELDGTSAAAVRPVCSESLPPMSIER